MTTLVGKELPAPLLANLRADPSRHRGKVILALTTNNRGWPHVAMLSHWEVLAMDKNSIRIATYDGSTTTKNIERSGAVTLVVIDRQMAFYIKGKASFLGRPRGDASNKIFGVRVGQVLKDELHGTEIVTGIRYSEKIQLEPHALLREQLEK